MEIRFINTTTPRPVDSRLRERLMLTSAFEAALRGPDPAETVDIFFVSDDEFEIDRERLGKDADPLGVYFSRYEKYGRRIIKIANNKIYETSQNSFYLTNLSEEERYITLLLKVVIHELSHWVMDQRFCAERENFPEAPCLKKDRNHLVEESLANALALNMTFNSEQRSFLIDFIREQPPAYKAGLQWKGEIEALTATAISWRKFKRIGFHHLWEHGRFFAGDKKLISSIQELENGIGNDINPFLFHELFHYDYLERTLEDGVLFDGPDINISFNKAKSIKIIPKSCGNLYCEKFSFDPPPVTIEDFKSILEYLHQEKKVKIHGKIISKLFEQDDIDFIFKNYLISDRANRDCLAAINSLKAVFQERD